MSELKILNGDATAKYLGSIGTGATGDPYHNIPADFKMEVAKGNVVEHTLWNKFGYNDDVDTGAQEIIASFGGTYTPPTTAETLTIVSSSAQDIVTTGTGINAIVITGIDANRLSQVEVVNMNGTTNVVTTSTWLGINRVAPFLCGTGLTNAGTITITNTTSGDTLAEMPVGQTVTQQAIFHVQTGYTFLADFLLINAIKITGGGGDPEITVRGYVFSPVANANILIFKSYLDTSISNSLEIKPVSPFPVSESSVLFFTAETNVNNTAVNIRFSGIESKN